MSKVLYFGVPAHGHTNPSLGLVRELVRRGERVIYYSFPPFREKIEDTGAEYRTFLEGWELVDQSHLVSRMSFLYQALVEALALAIEPSIAIIRAESPDYVIHDSLASWGQWAAQVTNTPCIASISTFVFRSRSIDLKNLLGTLLRIRPVDLRILAATAKKVRSLRATHGVRETGFLELLNRTSPLNLVYTAREFQPGGRGFDPHRFRFIGPSLSPRATEAQEPDYAGLKKPLVYLSLGTILHDQRSFYAEVLQAFGAFPGSVVISLGSTLDPLSFGSIPSHFTLLPKVNQIELLRSADVFITHGGMNSVHEGLYFGVPLVLLPFQEEQRTVARRCAQWGCGRLVPRRRGRKVFQACQNVLNTPRYRQKAGELSEILRNTGGAPAAVDAIFEYKTAGYRV